MNVQYVLEDARSGRLAQIYREFPEDDRLWLPFIAIDFREYTDFIILINQVEHLTWVQ